MLDKFFGWWPLAGLLVLGGLAQLISTLWPGLKGTVLLRIVVLILAALFGVWALLAPQDRQSWSSHSAEPRPWHHHDEARRG
jgi:hypothetical protein